MNREDHWERVYSANDPAGLSWYAPHLERSIALIRSVAKPPAAVIDVGGGSSTLVDDLLSLGYELTVLDVSQNALDVAQQRLGDRAKMVTWIAADVTAVRLPKAYAVWHDRAAFHFLTDPANRRSYVNLAAASLPPGAHAIVSTFSLEAAPRCSGLNVVRYTPDTLFQEFAPHFSLQHEAAESHRTPSGTDQPFIHCLFKRI